MSNPKPLTRAEATRARQQRKAARALAAGATHAEAAKAAGVSTGTIRNWRRTVTFQAMIVTAQGGTPPPAKRPGHPPMVVEGFRPQYVNSTSIEPWWTEGAPAARALAALRIGATWELAAHYARLHEHTIRTWNTRGAELMAAADTIEDVLGPDVLPEDAALAAFHMAVLEARSSPTIRALDTMSRAAGSDWRAADRLIARLPKTREVYAEVHKSEISGPGGGPIELAPAERVAALIERARAQREQGAVPDVEQGDDEQAGDG